MDKLFIFFIILISSLYAENSLFKLNDINISKLCNVQKKYLTKYLPKEVICNELKRELYFAKKYKFKNKKEIMQIGAINSLYSAYYNYLLDKYKPNNKVIRSFYEEYKNDFGKTIEVNLSYIVLNNINLADKIYNSLTKNPKKFKEFARKYSIAKNYQLYNININKLPYNVRKFIRTSKVNTISKPIKTENYIYIYMLNSKKIIIPTYKNLKPSIKKLLSIIYVKQLMDKMYEEQK